MTWAEVQGLIQTVSVILAMLVAASTLRGRDSDRTATLAKMQADIEYIKARVSGYDALRERITKVERDAAGAHRRIDEHLEREHGRKEEQA